MQYKLIYFLGIGGIGMSALARWFRHAGYEVRGYDRTETALTRKLAVEGIHVHYHDMGEAVGDFLDKNATLVVFTPAVPPDMGERRFLEEQGYVLMKRAEVLGIISRGFKTCAVAGTHGKTTVSSMAAHIFKSSPLDCTAFLGGISKNYHTNLLLSSAGEWMVAEADEFDRSFLQLYPDIAVVTSTDADHLDIYGTHDSLREAFGKFVSQIKPGGKLVIKKGLPLSPVNDAVGCYTYSLSGEADFFADSLRLSDEAYVFDLVCQGERIKDVRMTYPGLVNVENAVAASAVALLAGVPPQDVAAALASYAGVERRFDVRLHGTNYMLIDDYAHHPRELKAIISSVRGMYPGQRITGIFQPHLYSRTSDFAGEMAYELNSLDEVILLDIYPAREKPMPGVSSALIFDKLENTNRRLIVKEELTGLVATIKPGIVLMMGAGDIDALVEPVCEKLKILDGKGV